MPCYSSLLPKEIERNGGKEGWDPLLQFRTFAPGGAVHRANRGVWRDHLLVKAPMGVNIYVQQNRWDAGNLPGHLPSQLPAARTRRQHQASL